MPAWNESSALNLGKPSSIVNKQDKWGWPLFLVAFEGSLLWPLIFDPPLKESLLVIVGGIVTAFVVFTLTELSGKIDALSRDSEFIIEFIADQRVADWAKDKPHYEEVRTSMATDPKRYCPISP